MKKKILFLLVCTFMLVGIVKADTPATGLIDYFSSYVIAKGEHVTLNPTVTPDDATNKNVTYSSNDSTCATVDANGKVDGVGNDCRTKVTATTVDGNFTREYTIIVVDKVVFHGNGGKVSCQFVMDNSAGSWYYYLDENDMITRLPGTKTIMDAFNNDVASNCSVTKEGKYFAGFYTEADGGELVTSDTLFKNIDEVYAHWADTPTTIQSLEISTSNNPEPIHIVALNNTAGENKRNTINLYALSTPYYAKPETINWTSLNPEIATVNANGLVTGVAPGDATIKAVSAETNKEATYTVRVTEEAYLIVVTPTNQTIKVGDILQYKLYQIGPNYDQTKSFTMEINDSSIAAFPDPDHIDGKVKGLKEGTVTITVKLGDLATTQTTLTVKDDASHHSEAVKFLIKFEGGEGYDTTSSMDLQAVYLNEQTTINKNAFTKKGYVFAGWLVYIENADGTRVAAQLNGKQMTYEDGADISKLNIPEGATLVLVAQWVTNPNTGAVTHLALIALGLLGIYLFLVKSKKFNKIANI